MKRLHEKDINTPAYYENVWRREGIHRYDAVRHRAFITGYIRNGDGVLDLGAGMFGFAEYLMEMYMGAGGPLADCQVYAVDYSTYPKQQAIAKFPRLNYVTCDARNTPFTSAWFDVVGSGELIEHLEKPEELAREMWRVCRPGGWMIVSTLNPDCEDAKRHGDYPEHLWSFTPDELVGFFAPFGKTTHGMVGNYHVTHCRKSA